MKISSDFEGVIFEEGLYSRGLYSNLYSKWDRVFKNSVLKPPFPRVKPTCALRLLRYLDLNYI